MPETSRRIFVFGAGASREATKHLDPPLPLALDFFLPRYLTYFSLAYGQDGTRELQVLLEQFFGTDAEHSDADCSARPNVEEVYGLFTTAQASYLSGATSFEKTRRRLLEHIVRCVDQIARSAEPSTYLSFAQHLRPHDSVVSFNWDTLLDRAFSTTTVGKALLASRENILWPTGGRSPADARVSTTAGVFLKPHGSTDLAVCATTSCERHVRPYRLPEPVYDLDQWRCEICGGTLESYILPPHVFKSFGLSSIAAREASHLSRQLYFANEVIAFGYSFPALDVEANNVFRLSRRQPSDRFRAQIERLVLINPEVMNRCFVRRVRTLFGVPEARTVCFASFEEYQRTELSVPSPI